MSITEIDVTNTRVKCPACGNVYPLSDIHIVQNEPKLPILVQTRMKQLQDQYQTEIQRLTNLIQELQKVNVESVTNTEKIGTGTNAQKYGNMCENIAPLTKQFTDKGYDLLDVRHIGYPSDFIVLDGLNSIGHLQRVGFVEVKTNKAKRSHDQSMVKEVIDAKLVFYDTIVYQIGEHNKKDQLADFFQPVTK
jgi:predicted Holliday junction resolvase-like endonuclease